jgi:5-methylcytosine-specific restriction endonuclease McrA
MPRYWTCHWTYDTWNTDVNKQLRVDGSVSNSFRERGVQEGDAAYIISLSKGYLYLGGKMTVRGIISRSEAVRRFKTRNFYPGKECIVGGKTGTKLNFHRRLSPKVTRQLRFISPERGEIGLFFDPNSTARLYVQATRGVRQLTPKSADLLDRIIEITDGLPRSSNVITVTEESIRSGRIANGTDQNYRPYTGEKGRRFKEGGPQRSLVNRYERNRAARRACIDHWEARCWLCGFDFGKVYGDKMSGFIHVHHETMRSTAGENHQLDAIRELKPLCPNCHAVVHSRKEPLSLERVRRMLKSQERKRR